MSSHTKEPWEFLPASPRDDSLTHFILNDDGETVLGIRCLYKQDENDRLVADLKFAVACVNACRGMAAPAATIKALVEALKELRDSAVEIEEEGGVLACSCPKDLFALCAYCKAGAALAGVEEVT